MIFQQLEWYANEKGYPANISLAASPGTIGGALAHRGIGIMSGKYGKIDDQCLSMEVVLPNGDIINTLPVPKHAAGPDLNQIFIGSEGTLGVITKATFKLLSNLRSVGFMLFVSRQESGYMAGRDIMQKVKPSILRFMMKQRPLNNQKNYRFEKKGCFMNLAVEASSIVDIEMEIILEIAEKWGAEDLGSDYMKNGSRTELPFLPCHIMDIPQMFGTMDTVATYANVEKIYLAMKKAIYDKYGDKVRYISHSSHWYEWGCMNYTRFIVDPPNVPQDPEEARRLHNEIWNIGVRAAMANGGVINDHHGIGLKLSRLMKEQYGPAMQVMEALKNQLDPNGIMNPYKLGL